MKEGSLVQMLDRQRVTMQQRICVRENLHLHFLIFVVCVHATGKTHCTQVREWMGGWSDKGL